MEPIVIGQVDFSDLIFFPDPAQTDGSGKTGLVAANLTVVMCRMETDNDAVVTDGTSSLNNLASITAAHADWGIKEIDAALLPGLYRFDYPDAGFAAGAWKTVFYFMITSSAAAPIPKAFRLVAFNDRDGHRGALLALPPGVPSAVDGLLVGADVPTQAENFEYFRDQSADDPLTARPAGMRGT